MNKPITDTSKQVYHADKNHTSITMPYLPGIGVDGLKDILPPSYFTDRYEVPGFELTEVQGHRLVLLDGEWRDHGWNAIWTRVTEKDS